MAAATYETVRLIAATIASRAPKARSASSSPAICPQSSCLP